MDLNKESISTEKTEVTRDIQKEILLTEEEYTKKTRQKTKETMNRVLRVIGLIASFILIYAAVFDTLFEMSYFGWMFDAITGHAKDGAHANIWAAMLEFEVYDDPMKFTEWVPKLGITAIIILTVIGTVYLLVYNIVDVVALCKGMIKGTQDITKDLTDTVKDAATVEIKKNKKKKPKDLFEDIEGEFKNKDAQPKKKKKESPFELSGLTEEEMDRLLSGESLENITKEKEEKKETVAVESEKPVVNENHEELILDESDDTESESSFVIKPLTDDEYNEESSPINL